MRRRPCTAGLPKSLSCVSGSASARSTEWNRTSLDSPSSRIGAGSGGTELADRWNRKTEDCAHVQCELGEVLRNERDEAGVVRPWRNLAEPHLVAAHEEFHAEDPGAAERAGHVAGDTLRLGQRHATHRLRLPGLAVIAVDLQVADRRAEARAAHVPHREQRDLVVERDESLDDHAARAGATALLRVVPGALYVRRAPHDALSLAGGTHHRLHDAREPERRDRVTICDLVDPRSDTARS